MPLQFGIAEQKSQNIPQTLAVNISQNLGTSMAGAISTAGFHHQVQKDRRSPFLIYRT
ncbi:MAG: hypothetical protein SPL30_00265 [Succinivibrio sp.]|jgi:hypothetical protein|nr:hypothetical protein [Succinivibrio sp.]